MSFLILPFFPAPLVRRVRCCFLQDKTGLSSARRKTAAHARRASPIRCSLPGSRRSFQQKPHRHRKNRSNHNGDNPSLSGERRTFLSLSAIHRPRDACPVPGGPFLPPRGHDRPCVGPAASSSLCIDLWSAQSADRARSIPCAAVPLRAQWAVAPFRGPAETRWSRMQGPAFLPQRPPPLRPADLPRTSFLRSPWAPALDTGADRDGVWSLSTRHANGGRLL